MQYSPQVTAGQMFQPSGALACYRTAAGQLMFAIPDDGSGGPPGGRSHYFCSGCSGSSPVHPDATTNQLANEHAATCHREPLHGRPAFPRD
ncbi:hypothetical protein [Actinomadura violacea]|uniref:Uncharacterized protein n=1 Tax=Actinomadura violacea TaxID=2819934 RepID=A0ABS3RXU5_9ACTN|nr:hypothetical protein [Actinomadura violacea]MBO2461581.1 hypothetical protein [Actinomadura violacea]